MENYTHTEKLLPDDLRDIGEFQAICDALNAEIAQIVAREQVLREEIDKIIGEIEG